MAEVAAIPTPITEESAVGVLSELFPIFLNQSPPEALAVYTLALAWIETGRGQKINNNNAGSVSCRDDGAFDFWRPPWFSGDNPSYAALHQAMLDGKAPRAFRSYESAMEGWNDFLREVLRRKSLVAAMLADDPSAIVRALVETKYSIDYKPQHAETFRSLAKEFRSRGRFAEFKGVTLPGYELARKSSGGGALLFVLFGVAVAAGAVVLMKGNRR